MWIHICNERIFHHQPRVETSFTFLSDYMCYKIHVIQKHIKVFHPSNAHHADHISKTNCTALINHDRGIIQREYHTRLLYLVHYSDIFLWRMLTGLYLLPLYYSLQQNSACMIDTGYWFHELNHKHYPYHRKMYTVCKDCFLQSVLGYISIIHNVKIVSSKVCRIICLRLDSGDKCCSYIKSFYITIML